jgi:hypothetical protein
LKIQNHNDIGKNKDTRESGLFGKNLNKFDDQGYNNWQEAYKKEELSLSSSPSVRKENRKDFSYGAKEIPECSCFFFSHSIFTFLPNNQKQPEGYHLAM